MAAGRRRHFGNSLNLPAESDNVSHTYKRKLDSDLYIKYGIGMVYYWYTMHQSGVSITVTNVPKIRQTLYKISFFNLNQSLFESESEEVKYVLPPSKSSSSLVKTDLEWHFWSIWCMPYTPLRFFFHKSNHTRATGLFSMLYLDSNDESRSAEWNC